MLGVVVQIDGYDPVLAQPVSMRAASHDDATVCHLGGGEPWWPALIKLPTLRYDLFDGAFGGEITAPSSSLTIAAEPWTNLGRYALADARLRLWTGDVGAAWDSWTLRFDGRVTEQPELADGTASISFAVDDRWLDAALLKTYAGTGGAEGTEALKGQPKPLALGAPRYVSGTLVDSINTVFQVSAYGQLHGFEAALERLARFGAPVGNFASYADLVAADLPAGRWATAKAVGMARLGAPPSGQVSFLVGGDEAGPNGWARLPGAIIRRLALLSGGAGKINDGSLNALDVARPYNQSVYVDQQTTARQLIQQIAASVNAVAGMSWTGQLFVVPVGIGAPGLTLAADGSALPPVNSVKQVGIASPFQKLAIGAARAWTVHALSDIAFTAPLVDLGRYAGGTTYREGNIVDLEDGSRWLYTATTPTAGNAPSLGSSYWTSLSAPIRATYDDGTPVQDLKPAQPGADVTVDHFPAAYQAYTGRSATDVVEDLNVALGSLSTEILRNVTFRGEIDEIVYMPDGTPVRRVVQVLSALVDGSTAYIAELRQVDGDGNLKAAFVLNSQGHVTGVTQLNDGTTGSFYVVADEFGFVDPNGGAPTKPLYYVDGILYLDNVKVRQLDVDIVKKSNIVRGEITNSAQVTSASTLSGYGQAPSNANPQLVVSYNLVLDADADVDFTVEGSQSYTGDADFGFVCVVDGTSTPATGSGGVGSIAVTFSRGCTIGLSAGSHTVQFFWRGSAGVSLISGARLGIIKRYR